MVSQQPGVRIYQATFNALDIIANLKLFLDGKKMTKLMPHFTGFIGQVEEIANDKGNFITRGVWEEVDDDTVRITELPRDLDPKLQVLSLYA